MKIVCMQNAIAAWFVTFALFFSLQAASQTADKSNHPLLDKYYPQLKSDTNKTATIQTTPVPVRSQVSEPKRVLAVTDTTSINKTTGIAVTPPKPLPSTDTTTTNNSTSAVPISQTTLKSEIKPVSAVIDTTAINKPANIAVPGVTKVQLKPAPTLYIDTRLGSSTPQYDTWQKNNNGAGAVTTSPK